LTCIAGYTDGKRVWLGADSFAGDDCTYVANQAPKVRRVGSWLIGASGAQRVVDAVLYLANLEAVADADADEYVRIVVAERLRSVLTQIGAVGRSDNGSTCFNGNLILGTAGRLFYVGDDFGVISAPAWGIACGTGETAALAALYTLRKSKVRPAARVRAALEAAEATMNQVRSPFVVEVL
jgi:hypothetical protein